MQMEGKQIADKVVGMIMLTSTSVYWKKYSIVLLFYSYIIYGLSVILGYYPGMVL